MGSLIKANKGFENLWDYAITVISVRELPHLLSTRRMLALHIYFCKSSPSPTWWFGHFIVTELERANIQFSAQSITEKDEGLQLAIISLDESNQIFLCKLQIFCIFPHLKY